MAQAEQIIELDISTIAFGGSGVGQSDGGMTVFVPYAAPEEKVLARIVSVKKRFAHAALEQVLEPSPWRVPARDPLYMRHAATQYEHLAYDKQVEIKQQQLIEQLQRIGGLAPDEYRMLPATASPSPWHYRNKVTLHPTRSAQGVPGYGFYAHDNRSVIPVTSSTLAREPLNMLMPELQPVYDYSPGSRKAKQPDCTLRIGSEGDTHQYVGPAPSNYVWLKEVVNGREFRVPLGSFFQVNIPVAEMMFRQAVTWIGELPVATAIDAYCGVGVISAHLPVDMKVEAFDFDAKAIEAARHNAQQLGLENRNFVTGRDQQIFRSVLERTESAETVVILDPPRNGCAPEALEAMLRNTCRGIVMMSCNPSTMARDLAVLCGSEGPYRVMEVACFDMFPQTAHIEAAALLEPKTSG